MIRCKAGFKLPKTAARLAGGILMVLAFMQLPLQAHDYLLIPLYGFDREVRDVSQRHLTDTLRTLLYRSEFRVQQTGYANSSGNLTNLQIATDFAQLARSRIPSMAPDEIDRDLYNAERFTVRLYESIARRWENLNPIPGLHYGITIRNAAYPFVFMESLQTYADDLGTYPFSDDLNFRKTALIDRQYGFSFQIVFN